MALHTQQSLSGFIASEPALSYTRTGDARFYAKIGQEHYERNDDGSFTKLETTFHDLVQYRKAAEEAYGKFRKSDWFIAEGYVKNYTDGKGADREEFVAKKLGHDAARTDYTVARDDEPAAAVKADTIAAALQAAQAETDRVVGATDPAPSTTTRPTTTAPAAQPEPAAL